jgi:hypothetical protein
MASRPILSPFPVIINGNMSGNLTSAVTVIQNLSQLSYDVQWTGTSPVGVLNVQVSNTYTQYADGSVDNPGNWTTILTNPVSGNSGGGFFDITATGAYAVRLQYVFTSGIGTMNATVCGKVA